MKERKNNVNTLLWLMVTLSVMVVFLTLSLSSCNSSVQNGNTPNPGPETVKITVIAPKEGGSIKVNGKILKETKEFTPKVGDTMAFEAIPSDGYKFKEWIPKKLGNKETFELTVDKNLNLSVEFEKDPDSMAILEFLEYKIGFDRKKKEKSDVIYGTDSVYSSDTLYDASTLGFGRKLGNDICYHGLSGAEIKGLTVSEVNEISDAFGQAGITEDFKSIYDGLNKRWQATKKVTLAPNKWNYYSSDETPDKLSRRLARLNVGNYKFALGSDKEDYKLYMKVNSISGYDSYMDLCIAFVEKNEPDKGYSVHFANVKNGKYEPYVLHNAGDSKYTEYPPNAEPKLTSDTEEGMRMFRLSSLLKISLENLHKKESKEWKYSEQDLAKTLLKKVKDEKYDIYIIFGVMYQHQDKTLYSGMVQPGLLWRNVLKFGDPIWAENQTQP